MHGVSNGLPVQHLQLSELRPDHGAIRLDDAFRQQTVTKIMNSPAWTEESLIVVAWNEDDYNPQAAAAARRERRAPSATFLEAR
jgi:hypothetical protein